MKKLILLLFLQISILASAQGEFTINGILPNDNYDGKKIYLKKTDDELGFVSIDSSYVNKNTFLLKGTTSDPPYLALVFFEERPTDLPRASMVIVEAGNINLDIAAKNKVGGTKHNEEFQQFSEEQARIIENMSRQNDKDISGQLKEDLKSSTYNYLDKNMTNGIGEFFIEDASKFLDVYQVIELIRKSRPDFQETPKVKFLITELLSQQPSVGEPYVDLTLINTRGEVHSISEYIGKNKYVLIDFWASWCGPCIKEVPNLKDTYKKYKNKGFEIVGISLDDDQYQWEQTIKRLDMDWPQLSDLRGWRSIAARLYKAKAVPLTFLVDNEGKVIAKNIHGEQLSNKLKELLD